MLYGCTQDAAGFAAATRMNDAADRHGFIAVYPQQQRGENPQCCWNWFEPQHQARGAGARVDRRDHPRADRDDVAMDRGHPPRLRGRLSAGGAMAAILAYTARALMDRGSALQADDPQPSAARRGERR
jgi:poly(3-hydroxybutyrate) depolymerase